MRLQNTIRISTTVIAVLAIALCIGCGFNFYRSQAELRLLKNAVPAFFQVDLTQAGRNSVVFQHVSPLCHHGCVLYLKSESIPTRQGLVHALEDCEIDIRLHSSGHTIQEIKDASITPYVNQTEFLPSRFHGFVPFASLDISRLRAPHDYTLELIVKSPSHSLAMKHCMWLVKYGWCPIEQFPCHLSLAIFLLSILAVIFTIRVAIRFHSTLRVQRRKPGDNGILYLLTSYPRWSETFIRLDINTLEERGLPITVAALFPGDCEAQEGWPKAIILSGQPPAAATTSRFRAGCHALIQALLPKSAKAALSLFRHRRLLDRLVLECAKNRIGHIHAEFADLASLLGSEAARLTGCTYSVGIHALDIHRMKYPPARLFANASFITSCNLTAAKALYHKCPWLQTRLHLIHHGVDLDAWQYMQDYVPPSTLKILFIGRLVPKKGVAILLKALDGLVHGALVQATLTIVGEGPDKEELQALVESLGVQEAVTWKGLVPHKELPALFRSFSCLCVPSIVATGGDQDGIPNVIAEAMAAGLPVIASQAGGISEILTEKTGWPVPDLSPVTLGSALQDCTSHPAETERRRKNARTHVEYNFDAKKLSGKRAYLFQNVKPSGSLFV